MWWHCPAASWRDLAENVDERALLWWAALRSFEACVDIAESNPTNPRIAAFAADCEAALAEGDNPRAG